MVGEHKEWTNAGKKRAGGRPQPRWLAQEDMGTVENRRPRTRL